MTATDRVSALVAAIDTNARVWKAKAGDETAIRHLCEALDGLLAGPLEPTPEMVEAGAKAIHAEHCCPCDPQGCEYPLDILIEQAAARLALAAVLPLVVEALAARMEAPVRAAAEALGVEG